MYFALKKYNIKQIRSIAQRLPEVYEQSISGYYEETDENGNTKILPNIVIHEINHERRIRKAYEKLGMDGVRSYLSMIEKIQKERREEYARQQNEKGK